MHLQNFGCTSCNDLPDLNDRGLITLVQNSAKDSDKPKTTGCKVGFYIFLGTIMK